MPFIGNQPALSYTSFAKQDFTTSATTSYTLDQPVANANELALFINFVRQEPTTAYTASGTSLTLTSATSASDDMYCVFLGKAVQTVNPPNGSVGLDKIDSTAKSFLTRNYRNIIINGDMSIAQRGTSFSSISAGNGTYPVDRFRNNMATAGTWTISQDTDVPSGQGFATSVKYDCTTANASLSAGSFLIFEQQVEGQNLQYLKKGTANAQSLTLSFWVKSNKTGTYIAELYDNDNTRQISQAYTISSASTWEKKTITYAGDTTGAFGNDNGASLRLFFWLAAGSSYTSGTLNTSWNTTSVSNRVVGQVNLADSTANEWYITGVQLEAGTTASDFEFLPVDVNLQRCQRYYYEVTNPAVAIEEFSIGSVYAAGQFETVFPYPVTMRAQPSSSVVCGTNQMSVLTNQANDSIDGLSGSGQIGINQGMRFTSGDNFGGTQGHAGRLRKVSADVRINFSAEL